MSPCENNLFIQFDSQEKKDYFLKVFENTDNNLFFESFISLTSTKLECYGTSSDIYIEYITFDTLDSDVIKLVFHTHEYPCLEFCKRLAGKYSVNIQLVYFNEDSNYSGKIEIFNHQLVKDEIYGYWNGLYILHYDVFWERLNDLFESCESLTFMELLQKNSINVLDKDLNLLKYRFDEFNLLNQFKNL
jgi:hypothetical protein